MDFKLGAERMVFVLGVRVCICKINDFLVLHEHFDADDQCEAYYREMDMRAQRLRDCALQRFAL